MKTLVSTVFCGHFEAYTAQNHRNLQGFVPGRRTNPCKYRRFVPFRSLQTPKKPFPTKSFQVFGHVSTIFEA